MKEKRLFLQWAVMASLIVVGAILAAQLGYAVYIRDEPTGITYVTLGIFALGTLLCGRLTWRLCGNYHAPKVRKGLKYANFSAHLCVYMGLFGTAVGYYIMLKNSGVDMSDLGKVIQAGFDKTSIAIVNTIVGIVTSIILQIQTIYTKVEFEYLEDLKEEAEDAAASQGGAS